MRPQITLDFPTFVQFVSRLDSERVLRPETVDHHAAPMTHSMHGLQHADFIIHYDNLQAQFNEFCESINVEAFELPHYLNSNGHPRAPKTPKLKALVRKIYAKDYEFLEGL